MPADRVALFDLGGVLVHLDHEAFALAWESLGVPRDTLRSKLAASREVLDWNSGRLGIDAFYSWLRDTLKPRNTEVERLRAAWCSLLGGVNRPMAELLSVLDDDGWTLACLSNTDPWHLDHMKRSFTELASLRHWLASCELGAMKPDIACYTRALAALAEPSDTVHFVDDNEDNVQAARATGMHALYHVHGSAPSHELVSFFSLSPEWKAPQ